MPMGSNPSRESQSILPSFSPLLITPCGVSAGPSGQSRNQEGVRGEGVIDRKMPLRSSESPVGLDDEAPPPEGLKNSPPETAHADERPLPLLRMMTSLRKEPIVSEGDKWESTIGPLSPYWGVLSSQLHDQEERSVPPFPLLL
uniref:Uncharacterized protein n=1 Tax=Chromera velia CCMP2878 TaxID=1169474 RepID=A0A0G4FKT6_9ALVE|eukprot:Cvel_17390.t1-p1 / transcript=Cvel_17390.t1 / gene=Cvel_17390 / organism=Chromera_velia_CCMP2878 / gene_product=hypothetical protein / transcript_product=hypothetical protein / location=Cvel_scaffold1384:15199-15624(-) / protein_length=142 / sequence_SO=supercontig / SO=protein_coding / is_pseudo=false